VCLIIDADCFARVFDGGNKEHIRFAPVWDWINDGKGRMIYGGTKYSTELRAARKFLPIVAELERKAKTVRIPDHVVDGIAATLKATITDARFNDEHLVALVIASRCRVVCTKDIVAISFLRRNDVFAGHVGVTRPSIYRGHKSHMKLCCDRHIVAICRERG
jgi:hypothetical protein